MSDTSFEDRLARLESKAAILPEISREPEDDGPEKPDFSTFVLIGLICVPMGLVASVLTRLALDPEITPASHYYLELMGAVLAYHLVLFAALAAALLTRLRRPILNRAVLTSFMGYGLMGAALAAALP